MKKDTPPTRVYQIVDWEKHYENAKSKHIDHKTFSCTPNKQDGLGYQLLLKEFNGTALYGAFISVTLIQSKHTKPRKGWLTVDGKRDSRPLTAKDISIKTHIPTKIIQRMLDACCDARIGWITVYDDIANCGKCFQKDTSGDSEGYQVSSESPLEGIEGIEGIDEVGVSGSIISDFVFKSNCAIGAATIRKHFEKAVENGDVTAEQIAEAVKGDIERGVTPWKFIYGIKEAASNAGATDEEHANAWSVK